MKHFYLTQSRNDATKQQRVWRVVFHGEFITFSSANIKTVIRLNLLLNQLDFSMIRVVILMMSD